MDPQPLQPILGLDAPAAKRQAFAGKTPEPTPVARLRLLVPMLMLITVQIALAGWLGWSNRWQISEDAVAYLRIASYYASWNTDLMVSGYWGPMLSWLIAPMLGMVGHPLLAARIAMVLTAVVFLIGGVALMARLGLPRAAVGVGAVILAVTSAAWSATLITPDLLVAGLISLGSSGLLVGSWVDRRRTQFGTGLLFGLAYLAKAIALPVFLVMTVLVSITLLICRPADRLRIGVAAAITLLAFGAVAGPWVVVLSRTYGRPVFSTTGAAAHAWVGPGNGKSAHAINTEFRHPTPGRVTTWEDPTELPNTPWSPFASRENLLHQLKIIKNNAVHMLRTISRFDWLRLGGLLLGIGLLIHAPWRRNLLEERWRLAGLGVIAVCVPYLPVFAAAPRYFYALLPFVLVVALGVVVHLTATEPRRSLGRLIGLTVIAGSFLMPHAAPIARMLGAASDDRPEWVQLAQLLDDRELDGVLAGGAREAMLVAYERDSVFLGSVWEATVEQFANSGAELIVVRRDSEADEKLRTAVGFQDLDPLLFGTPDDAQGFSLRVYRHRGIAHGRSSQADSAADAGLKIASEPETGIDR